MARLTQITWILALTFVLVGTSSCFGQSAFDGFVKTVKGTTEVAQTQDDTPENNGTKIDTPELEAPIQSSEVKIESELPKDLPEHDAPNQPQAGNNQDLQNTMPVGTFAATFTANDGRQVRWIITVGQNGQVTSVMDAGNGRLIHLAGTCANQSGGYAIHFQTGGSNHVGNVNWQHADCFTINGGRTVYEFNRVVSGNNCSVGR